MIDSIFRVGRRWKVAVTFVWLSLCLPVWAQSPEIPPHLKVIQLDDSTPLVAMDVPSGPSVKYRVEAWINADVDEGERRITAISRVRHASSEGRRVTHVHAPSYHPIDIVRPQVDSDSFYVVGWIARLNKTIIEKWQFVGPQAVGTTYLPGGKAVTDFSSIRIVKSVIGIFDDGVVTSAAFVPELGAEGKLLLFIEGLASSTILTFDIADEIVDTIFDTEPAFPALAGRRSMFVLDVQGKGRVLLFTKSPKIYGINSPEPFPYAYYLDREFDGVFEEKGEISYDDFYEQFPPTLWNTVQPLH